MVSFAEFGAAKTLREAARAQGLRHALGATQGIKIYLDNGAFSNIRAGRKISGPDYRDFVQKVK